MDICNVCPIWEGVRIVGTCDVQQERAESAAERYGAQPLHEP